MPRQARIPKGLPSPVRKQREGDDRQHVARIRQLGCCICNLKGDPHHLLGYKHGKGLSMTSEDRWAISICRIHHDALHRHGNDEEWLASQGIDGRALASSLWGSRGDLEAMQRVVDRFRTQGQNYRRRLAA